MVQSMPMLWSLIVQLFRPPNHLVKRVMTLKTAHGTDPKPTHSIEAFFWPSLFAKVYAFDIQTFSNLMLAYLRKRIYLKSTFWEFGKKKNAAAANIFKGKVVTLRQKASSPSMEFMFWLRRMCDDGDLLLRHLIFQIILLRQEKLKCTAIADVCSFFGRYCSFVPPLIYSYISVILSTFINWNTNQMSFMISNQSEPCLLTDLGFSPKEILQKPIYSRLRIKQTLQTFGREMEKCTRELPKCTHPHTETQTQTHTHTHTHTQTDTQTHRHTHTERLSALIIQISF